MGGGIGPAIAAWLPPLVILALAAVFVRASWGRSAQNMERAIASNDEIVRATSAVLAEPREIKELLRDRK